MLISRDFTPAGVWTAPPPGAPSGSRGSVQADGGASSPDAPASGAPGGLGPAPGVVLPADLPALPEPIADANLLTPDGASGQASWEWGRGSWEWGRIGLDTDGDGQADSYVFLLMGYEGAAGDGTPHLFSAEGSPISLFTGWAL